MRPDLFGPKVNTDVFQGLHHDMNLGGRNYYTPDMVWPVVE